MEIWLLLTVAGTIFSVIKSAASTKVVEVVEGSTVNLSCSVCPNNESDRCRIYWFFKNKGSSGTDKNLSNQLFNSCSSALPLTLHNVTQKDSGLYFCNCSVEIPSLKNYTSNDIRLLIKTPQEELLLNLDSNSWWKWIAVGASGFVLVILLFVCLMMKWKQLKRRDLESPVYSNMHPVNGSRQPSPRANTQKAESTYQNLRPPVGNRRYENSRRLSPNR